jgi:hypothetical protein
MPRVVYGYGLSMMVTEVVLAFLSRSILADMCSGMKRVSATPFLR